MVTTLLSKVIILAKMYLACKINKVLCVGAVSYIHKFWAHLPDSVHADQELQNHIFKKVGNVLSYHITSKPVKTSQSEESPKGSDKWEHKRQRTA